jgi:histidine triad (HIT) family protein
MSECLFCDIAAGEIPADVVWSNDDVVAFRDINPAAPTHILVIPRAHYANAAQVAQADPALAGGILAAAGDIAAQEGLTDYRLVFNTGAGVGQSVFHVHMHILGGRGMTWPPG